MRRYYYLAWGCMLFAMAFPKPAAAFEHLRDPLHQNATCQTACHLPENIERARAEKTQKAECTSCHQGGLPLETLSPFQAPDSFLLPESQRPNRRSLSPRPPVPAGQIMASSKIRKSKKNPQIPGMVFIDSGEFIMGSNERWDDESPEHINKTGAFYIDLYEITNRDYKKFVDATKRNRRTTGLRATFPKARKTIRSPMSVGSTRTSIANGPANACPTKKNGKKPRAGKTATSIPGATSGRWTNPTTRTNILPEQNR